MFYQIISWKEDNNTVKKEDNNTVKKTTDCTNVGRDQVREAASHMDYPISHPIIIIK